MRNPELQNQSEQIGKNLERTIANIPADALKGARGIFVKIRESVAESI